MHFQKKDKILLHEVLFLCSSNIKGYKIYSPAPSWKEEVQATLAYHDKGRHTVLEEVNSFFFSFKKMSNVEMSLVLPHTHCYLRSPWVIQPHRSYYQVV